MQLKLLAFILTFLAMAGQAFPGHAGERRTPVVEAIAKAGPAVVNIRTEQVVRRRTSPFFGFSDPFFEDFFKEFGPTKLYKTQSLGSGVIIDPRGYILTNGHVVDKASKIFVALPDSQRELEAELVGRAERIDLAVLKIIQAGEYPFLAPGRSDDLLIGETIIAIGNPLGLGHSVTTGIVSSPRRHLPVDNNMFSIFIQMDALINPGNSGGPLLNINGELIGINTAIVKQAQGIGFAIPIDAVKRVLPDLIRYQKVRTPYLGVIPGAVGQIFSSEHGRNGILVKEIDPDSPAAKASILFGDVILALDGLPVTSPADYYSLLQTYTPDTPVVISLLRGFDTMEKTVALEKMPANYGLHYSEKIFGMTVTDSQHGPMISKVFPDMPAAKAGIAPGDLVSQINGRQVDNLAQFIDLIEAARGQEPLRFLIVRNRRGYRLELP